MKTKMPEPRFLSREDAAAYVGVSPNTFDTEVKAGLWPPAMRRGAKLRAVTWDRHALDAMADRHSGLAPTPPQGDTTPVVKPDPWAERISAAIGKKRTQDRPQNAIGR